MAGANRSSINYPETRFANLFAAKHRLTPPVDVEALISRYADIQRDVLPGTADAVLLRRESRKNLIVVSRNLNPNRLRFTLAHELGHIVLPWQVGSAFCHPDVTYVAAGGLHQEVEIQANRFATALLFPRDWALAQLGSDRDELADRIVAIAEKAGVSPITAMLSLGSAFPFPAATCVINRSGKKLYATASDGLPIKKDVVWWNEAPSDSIHASLSQANFGPYTLFAITFDPIGPKPIQRPAQEGREILSEILKTVPVSERVQLMRIISGIVGSCNNLAPRSTAPAELLVWLERRFFGRAELEAVTSHRRFGEYLRARAFELREKKRKG